MRTVTQGLADAGGIALDDSGNVYVANGRDGSVVEYSPGAAGIVHVYSMGLVHPVGVAVANDTLYVTDQGDAANGYVQQVLEYALGGTKPLISIGGLGGPYTLNEGIAVNPADRKGPFYVSASSVGGIPPAGCPGTYVVAKNVLPTLWAIVPLSGNRQAWGMAFDSKGELFVSDPCENDVAIYVQLGEVWTYAGKVRGRFASPMFLTVSNDVLAIPSAKGNAGRGAGYVTVIDLSNEHPTLTITSGLDRPIGAATSGM